MTRIEGLTWISLGVATGALALGLLLASYWQLSLIVLVLGLSWGLGGRLGQRWMLSIILVGFVFLAAAGFWLGVWPGLLVVGLLAILISWDLEYFAWRLRQAGRVDEENDLVTHHLSRLGVVIGLGLVLASVALLVQVRLSFGLALVLGLLAVLGLGQGVRLFRRFSE